MKKPASVLALLALATAASVAAPARTQVPAPAQSDPAGTRIARVENGLLPGIVISGRPFPAAPIAARMASFRVPGVSVAVIDGGEVAWAKAYGALEAGSAAPVTPETLFQAASISKSVATLAALRLVERGVLSLDEDVNARLVSWKVPENELTKTEKVTLRRLLSHTAGLTVSGFGGYAAGVPVPTVVQVLDGVKPANSAAVRVEAVPGSRWSYSGGGFTVMQLLMTEATGRPFPELMAELVLKPLGMTASTYEQPLPAARLAAAATAHGPDGKPITGRYHTYPEMAAAGLWTTPSDLARFLIEIQKAVAGRSSVLSAATAKLMTTVVKEGYGLGLQLQRLGPAASFGHGGSNEGFKCLMTAYIANGRGAVVMTNADGGLRLANEVLRSVAQEYGWPTQKPQVKTTVEVPAAALAALEGRYEMSPGHVITVALEGRALVARDGDQRIELYPESETRFFELVEETTVVFFKGPDGRPTHLLIDNRIKAPRLDGE